MLLAATPGCWARLALEQERARAGMWYEAWQVTVAEDGQGEGWEPPPMGYFLVWVPDDTPRGERWHVGAARFMALSVERYKVELDNWIFADLIPF